MYTEYAQRPSPPQRLRFLQNYVFSSVVAHRDYIICYFIKESYQAEPNKKVLDNESPGNDSTTEMSSDEERSS
ncbi:unnamed protein product [Callosobruchus maculatus]|uniref:Uncharacterized protein n=1 Tax=Callosobruchus maculatus TaxID=64391 RepID=A0A653DG67_CALMS|nr:unnamed protein product [Callosobruchus maculatus]